MKLILSPAKSLDFQSNILTKEFSQAHFLEQAKLVHKSLLKKTPEQLMQLMGISVKLAQLNWERNQNWQAEPAYEDKNTRQVIFAFKGDVYLGLDAASIDQAKIPLLQNKILILSGLYGILKPLDLIQAYRLEMGTKLQIASHKNLYSFWEKPLRDFMDRALAIEEPLINLASDEYFSVLRTDKIKAPIYKIVFKDFKNGQFKVISFFAKKARGLMARFIIDNDIEKVTDLKSFNYGGYAFSKEESLKESYVFLRKGNSVV